MRADGLNFIDVLTNGQFAGTSICGNYGSYFNGVTNNGTGGLFSQTRWQGSFHPNKWGQLAYARSFEDYIAAAQAKGVPRTSADLPVDPRFGGTQVTANLTQPAATSMLLAQPVVSVAVQPAVNSTDTDTLALGDLDVTTDQPQSCAESYQPGQTITVSGGGFAPGATVIVALQPDSAQPVTDTVTADDNGKIAVTILLPSDLTGPQPTASAAPVGAR